MHIEACGKMRNFLEVEAPTFISVILIAFPASELNSLRRLPSLVVNELSISNARMSRSLGIALERRSEY